MEDCVFCRIIKKEIPSSIEHEDEEIIVFHDLHPKAPLHLLIVPKKHIVSVHHAEPEDAEVLGKLFLVAQKVARARSLKGYTLQINVGREGGQVIDHVHMHLLAATT